VEDLEIDLLLRDADVVTLHDARPRGRAVAVHHGRVVAVLADDELPAGVRARRVVDAGGATVVPGFDDAHQHTAWFGQSLAEIPLAGLRDLDALYDAVAARAAELPADAFVVGSGYDDVALGGSPDRRALDRAGGGRPVWLKHRSAHVCAVSTEVLARAGVLDGGGVGGAAVPAGGVVVRDEVGDPTGVLLEAAQALAGDLLRPYAVEELADAIAGATAVFACEGLTHVTEAGIAGGWIGRSPRELAAYQLARERGDLAVRVDLMPEISVLHPAPGGPGRALDLGLHPGLGDLDLRVGHAKIFLDGALSSRTAAMREPYADSGDGGDHAGYLGDDAEVLHAALVEAVAGGWSVAAHAIGDRAVDAALDAFADAATRPWPRARPPRHRLEHAGVVDDAALARLAALGVTPVPQARFLYEIGDSMAAAVGDDRADLLYRHASFLRAGLRVPASSDRPCVADGHPLRGMQSMVQRRTAAGRTLGADEAVDAATALRAYTVDAAWVAGDEDVRGRLAPGFAADLVVLGDDVTRVDPDRIGDIEVVATLRGGRATHGADVLGLPAEGDAG
jgi:predicted amidohydrolase YtcJ